MIMHPPITFQLPEDHRVFDWDGTPLDPAIRSRLAVNHVVRIQVNYPDGLWEAIYVEILATEGENLWGKVLDTYRQFFEGETIYVNNGEVLRFPRACVLEVPLGWNPDLT